MRLEETFRCTYFGKSGADFVGRNWADFEMVCNDVDERAEAES